MSRQSPSTEPGPPPHPTLSRQQKARTYARRTRALYFVDVVVGATLMAALLVSGVSRYVQDSLALPLPLAAVIFSIGIGMAYMVVSLPLWYYRGFIMPRRYGLATQKAGGWLADKAKRSLLALLFGLAVVAFAYWALEAVPNLWWLLTGALVASVTVVLNLVAPVAILPLFFRCTPVSDAELSRRLTGLAQRAGTGILGVFTIDQSRRRTTVNAMLMGLGRTRRIVLSDGLTRSYSPEEIEAIMAHELGHHLHRDIPRLMAVQSSLGLAGFFLSYLVLKTLGPLFGLHGLSDIGGIPLIIMTLGAFSLAMGPFVSAYIRHLERIADSWALRLTGNAEAFISLMTKLADQNLNEDKPGRWAEVLFYDHPPYYKRVEQAVKFRGEALRGSS